MEKSDISWQKELADLVALAKTPEEKIALGAFASALSPFVDRPDLLRTLLGKIQRYMPAGAVNIVSGEPRFKSMDDLSASLGDDVSVIAL